MAKARVVFYKVRYVPCSDWLNRTEGLSVSAVFGAIWRYCCIRGMCNASVATLATNLGISDKTVRRSIKRLKQLGYIKDHSDNLRNHPHTFTIVIRKTLGDYFAWKKENPNLVDLYAAIDETLDVPASDIGFEKLSEQERASVDELKDLENLFE